METYAFILHYLTQMYLKWTLIHDVFDLLAALCHCIIKLFVGNGSRDEVELVLNLIHS